MATYRYFFCPKCRKKILVTVKALEIDLKEVPENEREEKVDSWPHA